MYHAISGEVPPPATRRVMKDPMVSAVQVGKGKYAEELLKAVDWALQLSEEDRPQSIHEWRKTFFEKPTLSMIPPSSSSLASTPLLGNFFNFPKPQWLFMTVTGIVVTLLLAVMLIIPYYQNTLRKVEIQTLQETINEKQTALKIAEEQLNEIRKQLDDEKTRRKNSETILEKIKRFEDVQSPENTGNDKREKHYDVVSVGANDVLNVRSFPGHVSSKTGDIPPNGRCIVYLGKFRILGRSVWVLIKYQDIQGWVNAKFLIENQNCSDK
jgi:hypothetical protein